VTSGLSWISGGPNHGTRKQYQTGCRCLLCRAANAEYQATLRVQQAKGLTPLGRLVPAGGLQRRLRTLLLEQYHRTEIARALGLHPATLRLHRKRVRYRTALLVERLYRDAQGETD
jgi:hypothetical protein